MIRLVAIDLDGTALDPLGQLTQETVRTVRQALNEGVRVVIDSGRSWDDAIPFAQQMGMQDEIITNGGATVLFIPNREILYSACFEKETALGLIDIMRSMPCMYMPASGFSMYMPRESLQFSEKFGYTERNFTIVEDSKDFFKQQDVQVNKICVYAEWDVLNQLSSEVSRVFPEIVIVNSDQFSLEFNLGGINKGTGLKYVADLHGFKYDEIMTIGDRPNDVDMFQYAAVSVAMGNSPEYVQKNARYITDSNANDGVAKAIRRFVLKGAYA